MKRFWYHCTQDNLGDRFVSEMRPPIVRGAKEPDTPRICVSRSIPACFAAVWFGKNAPVYVYRTVKPLNGIPARRKVYDAAVTDEHWIVHRAEFVLDRCILPKYVHEATEAGWIYFNMRHKGMSLQGKACLYAIAVKAIGGSDRDKRLSAKFLETLKIDDPETYLLRLALQA
jgi:hypothetical protein